MANGLNDFGNLTLEQQIAQLGQLQAQQIQEQQAQIKSRQNQLALAKQNQGLQVDPLFLPLAAAADVVSGGKSNLSGLASAISGQQTQRQELLSRLENSIANQQQAVGASQNQLLRTLLNERLGREQLQSREKIAGIKSTGKKLSGEQAKFLFQSSDALDALNDLNSAVQKQKQGDTFIEKALGGLGLSFETDRIDVPLKSPSEFVEARERFVEFFSRPETGAALTKDEQKLFRKLIPTAKDKEDIALRKIEKMKKVLTQRIEFLASGGTLEAAKKFTEKDFGIEKPKELDANKPLTEDQLSGLTKAQKIELLKKRQK